MGRSESLLTAYQKYFSDLSPVLQSINLYSYHRNDLTALDDALAPDFARCVDIHRKPGYDPVELFVDPALAFPKLKIMATLLRKKLGFRTLMNVIPLDATLVKGSHGRIPEPADFPLFITQSQSELPDTIAATDVSHRLKQLLRA